MRNIKIMITVIIAFLTIGELWAQKIVELKKNASN